MPTTSHAQYFYHEWLSNRDAQKEWDAMKRSGYRSIQIDCYNPDDIKTNSFFCEKKYSKDFLRSTLLTRNSQTGKSMLITEYHPDGRLKKTYDSSEHSVKSTEFIYDEQLRLSKTINDSRSTDEDFLTSIQEQHFYVYDENAYPKKMIRIKNQTDSLTILFSNDDAGNPAIEKDTRSGGIYYYFYDPKNKLTDIVPVNEFNQSMKPDYVFDYDTQGNLVEMKTTDGPSGSYTTWRYDYENGLKKLEKMIVNKIGLVSKFEYRYR
jgi:hypothetical protein